MTLLTTDLPRSPLEGWEHYAENVLPSDIPPDIMEVLRMCYWDGMLHIVSSVQTYGQPDLRSKCQDFMGRVNDELLAYTRTKNPENDP